jgi:hypothetical protein
MRQQASVHIERTEPEPVACGKLVQGIRTGQHPAIEFQDGIQCSG